MAQAPQKQRPEEAPAALAEKADLAFEAFKVYLMTRNREGRVQFEALWKESGKQKAFTTQFSKRMGDEFQNLLDAYKGMRGAYPKPADLAAAAGAYFSGTKAQLSAPFMQELDLLKRRWTMTERADTAFAAFMGFILTAEGSRRQKFETLWKENNMDGFFSDRFSQRMAEDLQPLREAYKAAKGDYPEAQQLLVAVAAYHAKDKSLSSYGPDFKKEMDTLKTFIGRANTCFEAFRDFVLTNNEDSRKLFDRLWQENQSVEAFFNQFNKRIKADPQFSDREKGLIAIYGAGTGRYPEPQDLAEAAAAYYAKDWTRLGAYGPAFSQAMDALQRMKVVPRLAAGPDAYSEAAAADSLLRVLDIQGVSSSDTEAYKMTALTNNLRSKFKVAEKGEIVAFVVLRAYLSLEEKDRQAFGEWLKQLQPKDGEALGARIARAATSGDKNLPAVSLLEAFKAWTEAAQTVDAKLAAEEKKLNRSPFKQPALQTAAEFEKTPTGFGIEVLEGRLDFLRKKSHVSGARADAARTKGLDAEMKSATAAAAEAEAEIDQIQKWLVKLGIKENTPEEGLAKLRAGLQHIESLYRNMDWLRNGANPAGALLDYIGSVSSNAQLFSIYKHFLSEFDKKDLNLFADASPDAPRYLEQIKVSIAQSSNSQKAKRGMYEWSTTFYPVLNPQASTKDLQALEALSQQELDQINQLPQDQRAAAQQRLTDQKRQKINEARSRQVTVDPMLIAQVAQLDPSAAIALANYAEASAGLRSLQETMQVAGTIARLHAVSPMLVTKYLLSITNLARVCEGNPEIYNEALVSISAGVASVTASLTDPTSPARTTTMNVRGTITFLYSAFSNIAEITPASLSRWDRYNVLDDQVFINPYPPHAITQRPSGWAPRLLSEELQMRPINIPYFLPGYIVTPTPANPITVGGVYTQLPAYSGGVTLPTFRPLMVYSSAPAVGGAFYAYLNPQHPYPYIGGLIPFTNISALSTTKLLGLVQQAFLPTQRPQYSDMSEVIGGGGALGVSGRKPDASDWLYTAGALVSLMTPTGGVAAGGSYAAGYRETLGGVASAVAVGKIPLAHRVPLLGRAFSEGEMDLDSLIVGYEKSLSTSEKRYIARSMTTQWAEEYDPVKKEWKLNPRRMLMVVDGEETAEGKKFATERFLYIDRQGTIWDLKAGQNDLLKVLNYQAGFADKHFMTPATYAWNVEEKIERGGGALAFDIDKWAVLLHTQAVPFFTPDDKPQPMLLQWTPAVAHTVAEESWLKRKTGADIWQVSAPGQFMRLKPGTDGRNKDDYLVQDGDLMMRHVEGAKAWELRLGGGGGYAPSGALGRGGFFLRVQEPPLRWGLGANFDMTAADFQAVGILQGSEAGRRYAESLYRFSSTAYYSPETRAKVLWGALGHMVNQWRMEDAAAQADAAQADASGTERKLKYDATLFRVVGFIRAVKAAGIRDKEWGARLDVIRRGLYDEMMADYQKLNTDVGQNPAQAANLMRTFQDKYASNMNQIRDTYNFALVVGSNGSLEFTLVNRETGGGMGSQKPETLYGRALITWDIDSRTGFGRIFAAAPLASTPLMGVGAPTMGIVGAGAGTDLFDSVFMQRMAVDAGIIVSRMEAATPGQVQEWSRSGVFVQGAVQFFSNMTEDSVSYRRLKKTYDGYVAKLAQGKVWELPDDVREEVCKGIVSFDKAKLEAIRSGEKIQLSETDLTVVADSLYYRWFYLKREGIQKNFDDHWKAYLGSGAYKFSDRTYWDVGAFVEYVDRMRNVNVKLYSILSKREEQGVFAGADVVSGRFHLGAAGGYTAKGSGAAVSAGVRWMSGTLNMPMEVGVSGYARDSEVPDYAAPFYYNVVRRGFSPEFGGFVYFTIGGEGVVQPVSGAAPTMALPGVRSPP